MTHTPDELDPDELDARWDDITSRLGPLVLPSHGEVTPAFPPPATGPAGPRDYAVEEDDGAFEEPDPQIDEPHPVTALGWAALAMGILGAFLAFATHAGSWLGVLSFLLAVGGLLTLVLRLPSGAEHPDDDGVQV